jgi:hypothetical protein
LECSSAVQLVLPEFEPNYLRAVIDVSNSKSGEERLSYEINCELYEMLSKKHSETIYQKRPANQSKVLDTGSIKFKTLSILEQAHVLKNILALFKCKKDPADLSLIGGATKAGVVTISNKISNYNSALLIHQSPTGLTTQTIDLLKL